MYVFDPIEPAPGYSTIRLDLAPDTDSPAPVVTADGRPVPGSILERSDAFNGSYPFVYSDLDVLWQKTLVGGSVVSTVQLTGGTGGQAPSPGGAGGAGGPVSISGVTGLQAALDGKASTASVTATADGRIAAQKAQPSGLASLGADGKLTASQLPDLAISAYLGPAANQTAMLALVGQMGDWCTRTDDSRVWVITGSTPTQIGSWTALTYPSSGGGGAVLGAAGTTSAAEAVPGSDPRLVAPTATTLSGATATGRALMTAVDAAAARTAAGAVATTDVRLTDDRTPKPHWHLATEIDGLPAAGGAAVSSVQWDGTQYIVFDGSAWVGPVTSRPVAPMLIVVSPPGAERPTWLGEHDLWYGETPVEEL